MLSNLDDYSIPVGFEKSSFESLFKLHQSCNICVNMSSIPPFGMPQESALRSDLQINPDLNDLHLLGSGRAGFFKSYYLKGIGRTPLCGNWDSKSNPYHSSGHLMASAAIREYVVSEWLKVCNQEKSIVSCEGLLFKKIDPKIKNFVAVAFKEKFRVSPVDRSFQAISVKKGNFVRFSNLVWLLSRPNLRTLDICKAILNEVFQVNDESPKLLAEKIFEKLNQSISDFFNFHSAGVTWGSIHNNFTIDGRFLDLETPTILGGPCLGQFQLSSPLLQKPITKYSFSEIFIFQSHLRLNLMKLVKLLSELSTHAIYKNQSVAREMFQLSLHVSRLMKKKSILSDEKYLKDFLVSKMKLIYKLDSKGLSFIKSVVESQVPKKGQVHLSDSKLRFATSEPFLNRNFYVFKDFEKFNVIDFALGQKINDIILTLDQQDNLNSLLTTLKLVPKQLHQLRLEFPSKSIDLNSI